MAYYRRRYRRYRPRRYVRRWFRRRIRRYVNGSSRSTIRVKVPIHFNLSFTQQAAAVGSDVARICPMDNSQSYASVFNSGLYRTYCHLYDEVKIIGMKCNVNVSSQVGGQDIPSLQIYTAFDRRYGFGEASPTFANLQTYSTFNVATAVNNSVAKLQRSIYAGDLLEKAQWHDSTLADPTLPAGNPDKSADAFYHDKAWEAAGANPNFFVPALEMAMAVPDSQAQKTVNANLDVIYYFAFRNPKYGAAAGANQRLEVENLDYRAPPPAGGDDDASDAPDLMADGDIDGAASASADEPARRSVLSRAPKQSQAARVVQLRKDQRDRRIADSRLNS